MRIATVVLLFLAVNTGLAQTIDWLPRIPLMQTGWQSPGALDVAEDSLRNRLLTTGWRLGTMFRTSDNGETWQGAYALGTDVVGKRGVIYVAPNGYYLWYGMTPWNQEVALTSKDGGETWRLYTSDTIVMKDGSYRGLEKVIPPTSIRAFDTLSRYVISTNLGETWRVMPKSPSDTIGIRNWGDEIQVAPDILYYKGDPFYHRFDVRTDTAWQLTGISIRSTKAVEVAGGAVVQHNAGFRIHQNYTDTTHTLVTHWPDSVTGENVRLSVVDVLRMDDSTAYVVDNYGFLFEVRPRSGHVRCIQPFGPAFPAGSVEGADRPRYVYGAVHKNRCLVVHGYAVERHASTRVWRVAELVNGSVIRIDTVPSRKADVVLDSRFPITYLGDRGMFMFTISNQGFREVVRSTNLGKTWRHIGQLESEELDTMYVGIRTTLRDSEGTLISHTMRDHCVELNNGGAIEYLQRVSGLESAFSTDQQALYGKYPTLYRDEHRVLSCGSVLAEFSYATARDTDTVLPRRVSFFRRLSPSFVSAGKDSLWLSFNNAEDWLYVSSSLRAPDSMPRGEFSDVGYTSKGTLLAAVRGVDYKTPDGVRGTIRYGGIGRSTDYGNTWQWASALPDSMNFVTRIERVSDSIVIAVAGRMLLDSAMLAISNVPVVEVDASAIVMSKDDGVTWTVARRDVRTGMPRSNIEPDICAVGNGVVLASTHSGSGFLSTDGGLTWTLLDVTNIGTGLIQSFWNDGNGTVVVSTSQGAGYLRIPGVTSLSDAHNGDAQTSPAFVAGELLHITLDGAQNSFVRIIGMDGRTVHQGTYAAPSASVVLSPFARGVYAVEITSASKTQRFIINW